MKQETIVRITSENGKMSLICSSETALGELHDFLLQVKGEIVERINKAQKEEEKATEEVKAKDIEKLYRR